MGTYCICADVITVAVTELSVKCLYFQLFTKRTHFFKVKSIAFSFH